MPVPLGGSGAETGSRQQPEKATASLGSTRRDVKCMRRSGKTRRRYSCSLFRVRFVLSVPMTVLTAHVLR